jgi:hypothetical protein
LDFARFRVLMWVRKAANFGWATNDITTMQMCKYAKLNNNLLESNMHHKNGQMWLVCLPKGRKGAGLHKSNSTGDSAALKKVIDENI